MCGRFTHMYKWRELYLLLNLNSPGATLPEGFWEKSAARFNVAPSQSAPVIRRNASSEVEAALLKWGLMPRWATRPGPINARAETVAALPMFRAAFAERRCIVPVSGFYEWQNTGEKTKQPWYVSRADGQPLLLAALWEPRDDGDTFAIITTEANEFMRLIHNRMPAVLEPESVAAWLAAPDQALLAPAADGVLMAHRVSSRVNSPKNDDPSLIDAV